MKEFWLWVIIVTLLLFCIMALSLMLIHVEKRINKADAIILRLEEKERRSEKARIVPKPDSSDGL
jgi:hypothetical protein